MQCLIPTFTRIRNISLRFAVVAAMLSVGAAVSKADKVVSPAGFENTEGNILFFPANSPYPDKGPQGTPDGWRGQEVHPPTAFQAIGDGPWTITGLAWRPDVSVNEAISTNWELDLYLSTTTKPIDGLTATFADNYGASGATRVFSGTVQLATDGVHKGTGLPHDFDYPIEFDTPYVYDPQAGNLLVEWVSPTDIANAWIWVDADDQIGSFTFDPAMDATEARFGGPGLFITEFTVIPEPTSWLLGLVGALLALRRGPCTCTR